MLRGLLGGGFGTTIPDRGKVTGDGGGGTGAGEHVTGGVSITSDSNDSIHGKSSSNGAPPDTNCAISSSGTEAALTSLQAKIQLLEEQLLASESEKASVEKQLNENIATFNSTAAAAAATAGAGGANSSVSVSGGGLENIHIIGQLKGNIESLQRQLKDLVEAHAVTLQDNNATIASLEVGQRVLTKGIRYVAV